MKISRLTYFLLTNTLDFPWCVLVERRLRYSEACLVVEAMALYYYQEILENPLERALSNELLLSLT